MVKQGPIIYNDIICMIYLAEMKEIFHLVYSFLFVYKS